MHNGSSSYSLLQIIKYFPSGIMLRYAFVLSRRRS